MKLLKFIILPVLFFSIKGSSEKQSLQDQLKEQDFLFQSIMKSIKRSKEMDAKENEVFTKWVKEELGKVTDDELAKMRATMSEAQVQHQLFNDYLYNSGLASVVDKLRKIQAKIKELE